VYRALRDMEDGGYVESKWDAEGAAGPARRVYTVTGTGRQRLDEWVSDLQETDRILHHFLQTVEQMRKKQAT
jgi:DNA-binding PadR family transcriptional regulator